MATRTQSTNLDNGDFRVVTWTGLLNGDDGERAELAAFSDRSVQFTGTFGTGGSVTLEGSNDGTTYFALSDPQGVAITRTAAGLKAVSELTRFIRPRVTAGDGTTSLTVVGLFRRSV